MLLIEGNTKLGRGIWHFSLPTIITCKPTRWCLEHCYAQKGHYNHTSTQQALYYRLLASHDEDFVNRIKHEIDNHNIKKIRLHVAGDFRDAEYTQQWTDIAQSRPDTSFVAFTRRDDLQEPIMELASLPNVRIRESLDESSPGKGFSELYSAIIESSPWDMGQRRCMGKCDQCLFCWTRDGDVVMRVH